MDFDESFDLCYDQYEDYVTIAGIGSPLDSICNILKSEGLKSRDMHFEIVHGLAILMEII